MLWSNFQSVAKSVKSALANWGPLSVWSTSGMPCSAKSSFSTEMVLEALHLRCRASSDDGHLGVVICGN